MKAEFDFEVQGSDVGLLQFNALAGIHSLLAPGQVLEDDVTWWLHHIVDETRLKSGAGLDQIVNWRAQVHGEIRLPSPPAYDEALGG